MADISEEELLKLEALAAACTDSSDEEESSSSDLEDFGGAGSDKGISWSECL